MSDTVNPTPRLTVDGSRAWLRRLWPARCLACGERGHDGRDLCAACLDGLPWNAIACPSCALPLPVAATCGACLKHRPPLDRVVAACIYSRPLDRLLPRFKFHGDFAAGRLLTQLMVDAVAGHRRPDVIAPVPLHPARLRQRGYDQALELARPLSRTLGVPVSPRLLVRRRATAAQSELAASARRRNVRGAFVANGVDLPMHVVLIDDVMTTGATLHAAAAALRRAGVQRVDAWVCARVP